jgi:hypothetical protein
MKNKKRNRREVFKSLKNPGDVIRIADRNEQIPTGADDLFCFVLPKPVEKEEAKALFQSLPEYPVNKRFYTGESLDIQDTFRIFADPIRIHIQTKFVNKKGFGKSLCKKHILLFAVGQSSDEIYSTEFDFMSEQKVHITYGPISGIGFSHYPLQIDDADIQETDYGYVGYVSFPWNRLSVDLSEIRFNVLRVDWGAHPMTSFIPVAHSSFVHTPKSPVRVMILMQNQGRMAPLRPTENLTKQRSSSFVTMHRVRDRLFQISGLDERQKKKLTLLSPKGIETELLADYTFSEEKVVASFLLPYLSEEGLYRIRYNDESVLYFDKRDAVESIYSRIDETDEQSLEKISVDIENISEKAKKMLQIVPPYSGLENVPDPKDTSLRPYMLFRYDLDNPQKIISIKTGDAYPDDNYPEDHATVIDNGTGKRIEYPYYVSEDGFDLYLTPGLWANQKVYICRHVSELADEDPAGAALVLYKLASCYKDYAPAVDYYYINYPISKAAGPPYPYFGGLWSRWFYHEPVYMAGIAEAYAKIKKTDAFEKLKEKYNEDMENLILYMIKDTVSFIESYGMCNGNMDPAEWIGLIRIGQALNRCDYILDVLDRIREFIQVNFMFDGFWKETTLSYHDNVVKGLLQAFSRINKDSENILKGFPVLQKAMDITRRLVYPNGKFIPVQDTHLSEIHEVSDIVFENFLLPCSKIVRLAGPKGENHTQIVFLAEPKYGHNHLDALSFNLFSRGVEMIPDYGYTHTSYRYWTLSTLGHNTTVVDEKDSKNQSGGNLLQYVPASFGTVGLVRGADPFCYEEASVYDRQIVTVPGENGDIGYTVDIFRVEGGKRHEYTLNLCLDYDIVTSCSLNLDGYSETLLPEDVRYEKPMEELSKGYAEGRYTAYMFVKDVKYGSIENRPYLVSYVIKDKEHEGKGIHIHGVPSEGVLMIGKAPSMRDTRISFAYDLNDRKDNHWSDKLVIRKEGDNLKSSFVHVFEPFGNNEKTVVRKVEKLLKDPADEKDVLIKITCEGYTDYLFSAYDTMEMTYDGIVFTGSFGFVRMKNEKAVFMQVLKGSVKTKNALLSKEASYSGIVEECRSRKEGHGANGFIVNEPIPEEKDLKTVIIRHPDGSVHAYTVEGIKKLQGKTLVDIGDTDPGFTVINEKRSKMQSFPFYQWEGETKYVIDETGFLRP